ncbi:hypothetical protein HAX54_020112 [Datura stramonium]|uniref:Uncharacterized protein n=1 Tax=Datura stramonium TaxID=4076 RepID=A0ABS8USF5_DATST|nr:hypothetical protein [Datura stramonium]
MDCPVRGQSGIVRPTGSVAGLSTPAGPSGPEAQLGLGQGRGEASTPDYAYPYPNIFALDSQRVTEPPVGSMYMVGLASHASGHVVESSNP